MAIKLESNYSNISKLWIADIKTLSPETIKQNILGRYKDFKQ